jgi:hypothetical protein
VLARDQTLEPVWLAEVLRLPAPVPDIVESMLNRPAALSLPISPTSSPA